MFETTTYYFYPQCISSESTTGKGEVTKAEVAIALTTSSNGILFTNVYP